MTAIEREVASLTPLATFLREHGIRFDESSKQWVIYDRYYYASLKILLIQEWLDGLMTIIYKIPIADAERLNAICFHNFAKVKKLFV